MIDEFNMNLTACTDEICFQEKVWPAFRLHILKNRREVLVCLSQYIVANCFFDFFLIKSLHVHVHVFHMAIQLNKFVASYKSHKKIIACFCLSEGLINEKGKILWSSGWSFSYPKQLALCLTSVKVQVPCSQDGHTNWIT